MNPQEIPTPRTDALGRELGRIIGQRLTLTNTAEMIQRALDEQIAPLERELVQTEQKLNHFIDATTKPHSIDDATIREWDLANKTHELKQQLQQSE